MREFSLVEITMKIFLHTVLRTKRTMQLRYRDIEWWMKQRQLPSHLKRRVRHFERQRWAAMGGQDEIELIRDLPDGLRRDIKRYLCIDLVKKVHNNRTMYLPCHCSNFYTEK
jgi:cyclic nucleotide gated channel